MATVLEQWRESSALWPRLEPLLPRVEELCLLVVNTLRAGGCIYSCGNGGSAAEALHLAEEFTGRFRSDRRPLPAVCLAADVTAITCIGNDFGFDHIFSRPLEALGRAGDLLVVLSTSGNSNNILEVLKSARTKGIKTALLGGREGGKAVNFSDLALIVPSQNTARIQEVHLFVIHAVLEAVEEAFPA